MGGARSIGRSGVEIIYKSPIILDFGVDLGASSKLLPSEPRSDPEALILTHAHLDHYGASPYLLRRCNCDTYVTPPTVDVGEILLKDFISLSSEHAERPYSTQDIQLIRRRERSVRLNDYLTLDGWELRTFNAGHVLGSIMIHLTAEDGPSILYTGDINTAGTRTLRGAETELPKVDYLIIEGTYGGDEDIHPSRKKVERQFIEDIRNVIASGGVTIIPTFALGRAQEVLLTLISHMESGVLQEVPIFVDGIDNVVLKHKDAKDGIDESNVDAIFLDIPDPWEVLPQVHEKLKPNGTFLAFLPSCEQVNKTVLKAREVGFGLIEIHEILDREYESNERRTRPAPWMVGHTGFIVIGRKISI